MAKQSNLFINLSLSSFLYLFQMQQIRYQIQSLIKPNLISITFQEMKKAGFIQLILGPMFSGKSSQMQRKVRRFQHAHKNCLVVNYFGDTRYSQEDVAVTHDKVMIKALKARTLKQVRRKALQYDIVAIDEGQFFPDIVQQAQNLANQGVVVIVAALDGTFQRKPFGNILSLVPLAESVTKLSAVCIECGNQAAFTKRIIDSQQVQVIGGAQAYKPVCRQCFGLTKQQGKQNRTQFKTDIKLQVGTLEKQSIKILI